MHWGNYNTFVRYMAQQFQENPGHVLVAYMTWTGEQLTRAQAEGFELLLRKFITSAGELIDLRELCWNNNGHMREQIQRDKPVNKAQLVQFVKTCGLRFIEDARIGDSQWNWSLPNAEMSKSLSAVAQASLVDFS